MDGVKHEQIILKPQRTKLEVLTPRRQEKR